jgi:hypothetical protein
LGQIALGVTHRVGKHDRTFLQPGSLAQLGGETLPKEDIIPEDETGGVLADKLFSDDKGIRQAARLGLFGIAELHAPLLTAAK